MLSFVFSPRDDCGPKSHLVAGGHLNLSTNLGPLDLLGSIGQSLAYSDLLPRSNEMDLGGGTVFFASERDAAMLPILRQSLRESKKPHRRERAAPPYR